MPVILSLTLGCETGEINEDTDGVWDARVQTVDDALQLLL